MSQLLSNFLLFLVRSYQVIFSPCMGGCCRFTPSCSKYAVEAIRHHQPHLAIWFIIKRILKCRPGGSFGYDPIPETNEPKRGVYGY